MTLDEAIQHCMQKVEENSVRCADYPCAMEHYQLAEWLKELKQYKSLFESPKEAEEMLNMYMV